LHDIPPRGAQSPTSDSSAQGGAVILSNRCSCPPGCGLLRKNAVR